MPAAKDEHCKDLVGNPGKLGLQTTGPSLPGVTLDSGGVRWLWAQGLQQGMCQVDIEHFMELLIDSAAAGKWPKQAMKSPCIASTCNVDAA